MPSVSIIFATSGRPAPLKDTLESLAVTSVPPGWSVEIILVENVAQSGAEALLRAFPRGSFSAVKYFFEPARGKSRALNLALTQAAGEILLFSDDDVRFPADWIGRMCEPILAGRADGVAGGVRLAPHLLRPWMQRRHRAWLASTADYITADNPSEMCGANMAVSRRALDQAGGFDPELGPGITGGGEESLLSWQIKKAGLKLVALPSVEIEHHFSADRLQYRFWVKAATGKGEADAYQLHHWFHQTIPFARLKGFILGAKLALRRLLTARPKPEDEGIALWELSYIEERAKYDRYVQERTRDRLYSSTDLRKLNRLPRAV